MPALMMKGVLTWEERVLRRLEIKERTSETVDAGWDSMASVRAEIAARIGGRGFGEVVCEV